MTQELPPDYPRANHQWAHFRVAQEIARGNMGVVFRAEDTTTGQEVALKVLLVGRADAETAERFRREARSLARLSHRGIVAVHSFGVHSGIPFLTMDFVAGTNLQQLIDAKALSLPRAVEALAQVARGIDHAHARGIVHRDLKPANVLVGADGHTRITDFGLARLSGSVTLTNDGDLVGTPVYMSPEQVQGRLVEVGPATDIWSLGVILYLVLTQRLPFVADTVEAVGRTIVNSDPIAPRQLERDVPEALERICLRALAKEPGERYPSASELALDLESYLRGKPVLAGTVTPGLRLRRAGRFVSRHRLLGVTLALLVALLGLIASLRSGDAERERGLLRELLARAAVHRHAAASALTAAEESWGARDLGQLEEQVKGGREELQRAAAYLARAQAAGERPGRLVLSEALGQGPSPGEVGLGLALDPSLRTLEARARALERRRALSAGAGADRRQALEETASYADLGAALDVAEYTGDLALVQQVELRLEEPGDDPRQQALSARLRGLLEPARYRPATPRTGLLVGPPPAPEVLERVELSGQEGRRPAPGDLLLRARARLGSAAPAAAAGDYALLISLEPGPLLGPLARVERVLATWAAGGGQAPLGELVELARDQGLPRVQRLEAARVLAWLDPGAVTPGLTNPSGGALSSELAARDRLRLARAGPAVAEALASLELIRRGWRKVSDERARLQEALTALEPTVSASRETRDLELRAAGVLGALVMRELGGKLSDEQLPLELWRAPAEKDRRRHPGLRAMGRLIRPSLVSGPPPSGLLPPLPGLWEGRAALAAWAEAWRASGWGRRPKLAEKLGGRAVRLTTLASRIAPFDARGYLVRARALLLKVAELRQDSKPSAAEEAERCLDEAWRSTAAASVLSPDDPAVEALLLGLAWTRAVPDEPGRGLAAWTTRQAPPLTEWERLALSTLSDSGRPTSDGEEASDVIQDLLARRWRAILVRARGELRPDPYRLRDGLQRALEEAVIARTRALESARQGEPAPAGGWPQPWQLALDRAQWVLEDPRRLDLELLADDEGLLEQDVNVLRLAATRAPRTGSAAAAEQGPAAATALLLLRLRRLPADPSPEELALFRQVSGRLLEVVARGRVSPSVPALRALIAVWGREADLPQLGDWTSPGEQVPYWSGATNELLQRLAQGQALESELGPEARKLAELPALARYRK